MDLINLISIFIIMISVIFLIAILYKKDLRTKCKIALKNNKHEIDVYRELYPDWDHVERRLDEGYRFLKDLLFSYDVEEDIKSEINRLKSQYINHESPATLTQGPVEVVNTGISKNSPIFDYLPIRLSGYDMKLNKARSVCFLGSNYKFVSKYTETQFVLNDKWARWEWDVSPFKYRFKNLELLVSFIINIQNKDVFGYPIQEKSRHVNWLRLPIAPKLGITTHIGYLHRW